MSLFLLSYIIIYGGMQGLVYAGLAPVLPSRRGFHWALSLWMAAMVGAPILTHVLDHAGFSHLAKLMAWIGYSWMGGSFIAFWSNLIAYGLKGFIAFGAWAGLYRGPQPSSVLVSVFVLVLSAGLILWAVAANRVVHLRTLEISTPKMDCKAEALDIVFISDVHLGLMNGPGEGRRIRNILQDLDPDLILCAGDMIDSDISRLDKQAHIFRALNPKLGKYAVLGNHETYLGRGAASRFFERAGFDLLIDEGGEIGQNIALFGLDYARAEQCTQKASGLRNVDPNRFSIVLKHAPTRCAFPKGDLQLSGHTHKGQIFPFGLIVKIVYPLVSGLYVQDSGERLYVSQGTGSWGPQMRLLTRREITVITLRGVCSKDERESRRD